MTVATSLSVAQLVGDGSTTAFPAAFPIFDQTHIEVYLGTVLQTLTTHYTVSGVGGASFTVNFVTAPGNGVVVTIQRVVPLTQLTDYLANDPFPAETHERALDLLTMEAQQIAEAVGRAIKKPTTDATALDMTLPAAAARAGKYLIFDGTGLPTVTVSAPITSGDLDGGTLILDGDADTLMRAPVDDQLDFNVGAERVVRVQNDGTVKNLLELRSSDAGAAVGPTLALLRDSASPAAADFIGQLLFDGKDGAGNQTSFAKILGRIDDPTNGSEDASVYFQVLNAGIEDTRLIVGWYGIEAILTDAGAGAGPDIIINRNSASPAANDFIGRQLFYGKDSTAVNTVYASIEAQIIDPVNGSEDGKLILKAMAAGTLTEVLNIAAAGLTLPTHDLNLTAGQIKKAGVAFPFLSASDVATTSGTTVEIGSSIPAWAKEVTISFNGISVDAASHILVQLGTAGSYLTSGYDTNCGWLSGTDTTNNATQSTAGFLVKTGAAGTGTAAGVIHGHLRLTKLAENSNIWIGSLVAYPPSNPGYNILGAGVIDLGAALTRIRLNSVSGTANFDAGSASILVR